MMGLVPSSVEASIRQIDERAVHLGNAVIQRP